MFNDAVQNRLICQPNAIELTGAERIERFLDTIDDIKGIARVVLVIRSLQRGEEPKIVHVGIRTVCWLSVELDLVFHFHLCK